MHPKAPSIVHNPTEFVAADPQHQHPPNLKFWSFTTRHVDRFVSPNWTNFQVILHPATYISRWPLEPDPLGQVTALAWTGSRWWGTARPWWYGCRTISGSVVNGLVSNQHIQYSIPFVCDRSSTILYSLLILITIELRRIARVIFCM